MVCSFIGPFGRILSSPFHPNKRLLHNQLREKKPNNRFVFQMQRDPPGAQSKELTPAFFLLISEVNLDSSAVLNNQFVELQAIRNMHLPANRRGKNLVGYRLLIVTGSPLEIVASIDIEANVPRLQKEFITFGTKNVQNVDVVMESPDCPNVYKSVNSILPPFDDSPFAIIIIHSSSPIEHEALSLTKSEERFEPSALEKDMWRQEIIRKNAIDMVVLGRKAPTNGCSFFDTIFPPRSFEPRKSYLLRDWEARKSPEKDMSINRCCDDEVPFSPKCFLLSYLTPGRPNDCSQGRRFVLEENLVSLKGKKTAQQSSETRKGCEPNYQHVAPEDMEVDGQSYFSALQHAFSQNTECLKTSAPITNVNSRNTPEVPGTTLPPLEPNFLDFDQDRFSECRDSFTRPDDIVASDALLWLGFVNSTKECRFYCHVCREFIRLGFRPDIKVRADIVREKGSFSKFKATNSMLVRKHRDHKLHQNSMKFYREYESAETDTERQDAIRRQYDLQKAVYKATMNVIQMAYIELTAGVSFRSHKKFMNGVNELGVNVGIHHRHEKAIADISDTLAKGFHYNLLKQLVTNNKPFTVIADGTTIDNVPYMAVMIQTLEDDRPIVYVYALLVLTNGEASESMVKDLKDRISQDDKVYPGFESFFKANCMVVASDQANNMIGRYNSFHTHLQRYLGHEIALVKCGAHKLSRILLHALNYVTDISTNDTYFANFADINNKFYSFYMSRGSKRFIDLTRKAEELGIAPNRIKYHFDVRFAASQFRCMKTLYDQFDALKLDLLERVTDPTFDLQGQAIANMLHNYISDKAFAITVAEFVDFLEVFQRMSRRFQLKGGLMIGNVEIVRDGFQDLMELQGNIGSHVTELLGKVSCRGVCTVGQCTLAHYDECGEIITRTGTLESSMSNSIKLGEERETLYQRILDQMKRYFDHEVLEAFDVFNPKFFKFCPTDALSVQLNCQNLGNCYLPFLTIDPDDQPKSAEEKLLLLCTFYKMGTQACGSVISDWKDALTVITTDKDIFEQRQDDVSVFWPNVLQRTDLGFTVGLRSLFEKVLITSFTSSDAERLFSQVTRIKTPERFNLKPSTLEGLARIQFNGPEVLSSERLYEYTHEFLKTHVRSDDTESDGGRIAAPEEYPNFFAKSRIF